MKLSKWTCDLFLYFLWFWFSYLWENPYEAFCSFCILDRPHLTIIVFLLHLFLFVFLLHLLLFLFLLHLLLFYFRRSHLAPAEWACELLARAETVRDWSGVTCGFHILKYFIFSFKLSYCKQDEGLDAQNAESPHPTTRIPNSSVCPSVRPSVTQKVSRKMCHVSGW